MIGQPRGSRWVVPMVIVAIAVLSLVGLRHARPGTAAGRLEPIRWAEHLPSVDRALAAGDVNAAVRAWHTAHAAALASGSWEAMIEAGDAYLRIGRVAGARAPSEAKARQAYLVALFRARGQGSIDGVLRATDAFAGLGDDEVVAQGIAVARALATRNRDAAAEARLGEAQARLAARLLEAKRTAPDRF
jgi:hypothetical protein